VLAGGSGGQGMDCPAKVSMQVSSALSAAVRPRARVRLRPLVCARSLTLLKDGALNPQN